MVNLLLGAAVAIVAANVVVWSKYKKYVNETNEIIDAMKTDADMALEKTNSIGSLEPIQSYINSLNTDITE